MEFLPRTGLLLTYLGLTKFLFKIAILFLFSLVFNKGVLFLFIFFLFLLKDTSGLLLFKLFLFPNADFGLFNKGLKNIFLFFKLLLLIGIGDFLGIPLGFFPLFLLFIVLLFCFEAGFNILLRL